MSTVLFSLPTDKVEDILPLLRRLRTESRGADRKSLDVLVKKMEPQLKTAKEEAFAKQELEVINAELKDVASLVLNVLPSIKRRGLTAGAVVYVKAVSSAFRFADKIYTAAEDEYRKSFPKSERASVSIPPSVLTKTLSRTRTRLVKAAETYKNSDNNRLEASSDYTLSTKRQTLAQKCFRSAISEGEKAGGWNELDMISLSFYDMESHLDLGVAILNGSPSKIDDAYSMDTACRDGLADAVWEFANDHSGLEKIKKSPSPKR